jgi:thiol-disulfide isomerase/thioredoxin
MRLNVYRAFLFALVALPLAARGAETVPAPRLETLNGVSFPLDSLKGKVVVLDFWAPWCIPCRQSFPALDALQEKYGAQGLRVVGLSLEDNGEAIAEFLEAVPVSFTILRDPTGSAGEAFKVVAMPTTFLLDREGRLAARFEGGGRKVHEKVEAAARVLLEGGSLPPGTGVRVVDSVQATGPVKAWRRGYLADPIMNLDGDALSRVLKEHIHASKEAAAGDGGAAGGGCGCN